MANQRLLRGHLRRLLPNFLLLARLLRQRVRGKYSQKREMKMIEAANWNMASMCDTVP
jgi:hypothetical protein